MKTILCIGEALIDLICTDHGRSLSRGEHFIRRPGGAPTNVAVAVAALGGRVGLVARVGADPFGKLLIEVMGDFGVSTKWVSIDEQFFTTLAFVSLMTDGERDFQFNRGADGRLSKRDVEAVNLDEVGIVHFGSATAFLGGPLQEAYYCLLERALDSDMIISFDPNYRHFLFANATQSFVDGCWDFLEVCDFFKVSYDEAILLTGASNLGDAVDIFTERTDAVFAITLGKEGTLLRCGKTVERVDSIPVNAVDSTGAGDAFVGAVLYQLSLQKDGDFQLLLERGGGIDARQWRYIVENANKAGARTCEYLGAMEAFKHLNNKIFQ